MITKKLRERYLDSSMGYKGMYPCQNSSNWILKIFVSYVCMLVTQSFLTLCDPMDYI